MKKAVKTKTINNELTWEEIPRNVRHNIDDDAIILSLTKVATDEGKDKKPLLSVRFGKNILEKMGLTVMDQLILMQAKENVTDYFLVKAESGYTIKKWGNGGGVHEISFRFRRTGLECFDAVRCNYKVKKGGVHITLPSQR